MILLFENGGLYLKACILYSAVQALQICQIGQDEKKIVLLTLESYLSKTRAEIFRKFGFGFWKKTLPLSESNLKTASQILMFNKTIDWQNTAWLIV